MLEKMGEFFDARLADYEEHQLTCIEAAEIFYPMTASLLPMQAGARVLDLGCGTGLELGYYFENNPDARVTGIDLAPGMLDTLRKKFPSKALTLCLGSYFDLPFGENCYDAAVSVESLHHFMQAEKLPLYKKLFRALTEDGYFILTDYFAPDETWERHHRATYERLRREEGLDESVFYHYDTPLTLSHETEALLLGGFATVEVLGHWENTYTLRAWKNPPKEA